MEESPDRGTVPRLPAGPDVVVGVPGLLTALPRGPAPVGVGEPPVEPTSGEGPVGVARADRSLAGCGESAAVTVTDTLAAAPLDGAA